MVRAYPRRRSLDLPPYPHPGKFEGELRLTEFLWDLTMEGYGDSLGESDGFGYYTLVELGPDAVEDVAAQAKENGVKLTKDEREFVRTYAGAILSENSVGFVSAEYYETQEELKDRWDTLEGLYEHYLKAGYGQQQLDIGYEDD